MQTYDHGDQVETDAGARDARRVAAAKISLEEPLPILFGYADSVIEDLDYR